ncbi:MAG: DMT family transporter [Pseudomonadales bacterium]
MSDSTQNIKAAATMVLAMAMFTSGDALIKFLSEALPMGQIIFMRGVLVCLLFWLWLKYKGQPLFPSASWNRWNLLRGFFELSVAACYLTGLMLLPLATAVILVFSGPIMLTILAALILKEKVGWRRWLAVCTGFIGVILVADLQATNWDSWAILLPLMAAFLTALRDIYLRNIPQVLSSGQIAFTTAWMVTLAGLCTLPWGWQSVSAQNLGWLSVAALFIFAAYISYVVTTRLGELSFIAPFKYTSIPLAMLLGYLVWGDVPSATSYLGTAIIVCSGIFIFIREGAKKRADG